MVVDGSSSNHGSCGGAGSKTQTAPWYQLKQLFNGWRQRWLQRRNYYQQQQWWTVAADSGSSIHGSSGRAGWTLTRRCWTVLMRAMQLTSSRLIFWPEQQQRRRPRRRQQGRRPGQFRRGQRWQQRGHFWQGLCWVRRGWCRRQPGHLWVPAQEWQGGVAQACV